MTQNYYWGRAGYSDGKKVTVNGVKKMLDDQLRGGFISHGQTFGCVARM